jgi:hypothetical protein
MRFSFAGLKHVVMALGIVSLVACAPVATHKDYSAFRKTNPRSVLVVPVMNRSVDVEAPDYFLSTISRPLAERGYYVFPVNLTKRLMEDDGLSDADMVHASDPATLGRMFGADSIMYVSIERWDARYLILQTTTTVELNYELKSGTTGETLWTDTQKIVYTPKSPLDNSGLLGLVAAAITAAVEKAKPDYLPLARQANAKSVGSEGMGLPAGPYDANYRIDTEAF